MWHNFQCYAYDKSLYHVAQKCALPRINPASSREGRESLNRTSGFQDQDPKPLDQAAFFNAVQLFFQNLWLVRYLSYMQNLALQRQARLYNYYDTHQSWSVVPLFSSVVLFLFCLWPYIITTCKGTDILKGKGIKKGWLFFLLLLFLCSKPHYSHKLN